MLALFGEFHDEAMESLATADELLLAIEGTGPEANSVDALFRVFHTIKGLAGFLDLGALGALAHAAEALLHDARDDLSTLVPARMDLLLRATTMIRRLLEATRIATQEGRTHVELADFDELLQQVLAARRPAQATPSAPNRPVNRPPPPAPVAPASSSAGEAAEEGGKRAGGGVVRETLKVDLSRVDGLVETIGELVIIEAMVTSSAGGSLPTRTQRHLSQLSKVVRDLQRQGLALRMVPLRGVFQKMNRLVRDLSRRSGKEIRLELSGQDAEMDRSLAERLGDPLVHMMRNAVDHGIETADERRAAGKPPTATVKLSAYHEGGNIIIELSDDGRGLNKDAILDKAVGRGLVSATAQLTDREIWELIFHPGFSTAKAVTELSGRGVGMDVVKKTVDELRGRIQIASVFGEGTTFRIVLPLTLAIIDGMLLGVGGRRYVLPTLSIVETLQPEPGQIHRFAGAAILDVRGQQLPLTDLGELLGVDSEASRDPTTGFIVVIDGIHSKFGLLTDQLIGQQQVVIKQIDPAVNQNGLFSGAAILSDGHVGLILNPAALRTEDAARRGAALSLEP
ncbi:MAG: chemotaxis protein CheW [Myxococcota bacterium]